MAEERIGKDQKKTCEATPSFPDTKTTRLAGMTASATKSQIPLEQLLGQTNTFALPSCRGIWALTNTPLSCASQPCLLEGAEPPEDTKPQKEQTPPMISSTPLHPLCVGEATDQEQLGLVHTATRPPTRPYERPKTSNLSAIDATQKEFSSLKTPKTCRKKQNEPDDVPLQEEKSSFAESKSTLAHEVLKVQFLPKKVTVECTPLLKNLFKEAASSTFDLSFALQYMRPNEKIKLVERAEQGEVLNKALFNALAPDLYKEERNPIIEPHIIQEARVLAFKHLHHEQLKVFHNIIKEHLPQQDPEPIVSALKEYLSGKKHKWSKDEIFLLRIIQNKTGVTFRHGYFHDDFYKKQGVEEGQSYYLVQLLKTIEPLSAPGKLRTQTGTAFPSNQHTLSLKTALRNDIKERQKKANKMLDMPPQVQEQPSTPLVKTRAWKQKKALVERPTKEEKGVRAEHTNDPLEKEVLKVRCLSEPVNFKTVPIMHDELKRINGAESTIMELYLALQFMSPENKIKLAGFAEQGEALNETLFKKIDPNFHQNTSNLIIEPAIIQEARTLAFKRSQLEQLKIFRSLIQEYFPQHNPESIILALKEYFSGKKNNWSQDEMLLLGAVINKTGILVEECFLDDVFSNNYSQSPGKYRCLVRMLQTSAPNSANKTTVAFPSLQETSSLGVALRNAILACQDDEGLYERHIKVLEKYNAPDGCSKQLALRRKVCADRVSFSDQAVQGLKTVLGEQITVLNQLLLAPPKKLTERTLQRLENDMMSQLFILKKISWAPEQSERFKRVGGFRQFQDQATISYTSPDSVLQQLEARFQAPHLQKDVPKKALPYFKNEDIAAYMLEPSEPLPPHHAYYHVLQTQHPFCQTCSIDNYLGSGLVTPEFLEQLSELSYFDQGARAPLVNSMNQQKIFNELSALLKRQDTGHELDERWRNKILSFLDVTQYTWSAQEKKSKANQDQSVLDSNNTIDKENYEKNIKKIKELAALMNANPVDRMMLSFDVGSKVSHVITLRREKGEQRWVILDSNYAPFSYTLEELLQILVSHNKRFTLLVPKTQLTKNVTLENQPGRYDFPLPFSMMVNYIESIPHRPISLPTNQMRPSAVQDFFEKIAQKGGWTQEIEQKLQELPSKNTSLNHLRAEVLNVERRFELIKAALHSLQDQERKNILLSNLDQLKKRFLLTAAATASRPKDANIDALKEALQTEVDKMLVDLVPIEQRMLKDYLVDCIERAEGNKFNTDSKNILKKLIEEGTQLSGTFYKTFRATTDLNLSYEQDGRLVVKKPRILSVFKPI